jgi:DNA-binding response OmpR family regulator
MPGKLKKILVVEDDVTMREIMVQKLKTAGFNVFEAEDGAVGIKVIAKEKPNLILLDLMLPEVDGFGVLESLRKDADQEVAKTPVIVLSNLWSKEEIIRTKQLGVSSYIIKAYMTTEEILDKVTELSKQLDEA